MTTQLQLPESISFTKMSGTGNDFIIIDNRDQGIPAAQQAELARLICRRMFSVGADGLILIEGADGADFCWQFYNADGSAAEMCGNGARCAARFAAAKGIAPERMRFLTTAGLIEAEMVGEAVKVKLTEPTDLILEEELEVAGSEHVVGFVNTGVPHVVYFVDDARAVDVVSLGRAIRQHSRYQPAGTNVNFVQVSEGGLVVRTYERGVEDETMACGTGAVASTAIAALMGRVHSPVTVITSGGERLVIHLDIDMAAKEICATYLEGPANFIYEGQLHGEALTSGRPG